MLRSMAISDRTCVDSLFLQTTLRRVLRPGPKRSAAMDSEPGTPLPIPRREHMRSLHHSADSLGEAILVINPEGFILWASAPAGKLLGAETKEIAGHSVSNFLNSLQAKTRDETAASVTGASIATFRVRNGAQLKVCRKITLAPVGDRVLGEVWTLNPPSERSIPDDPGHQRDSVSQCFLEDGAGGAFRLSPEGQFLSANSAFSELCGCATAAEFIAAVSADQARPFYVEKSRHDDLMKQLSEAGAVSRFESEIYRHDGTTTWISQNVRAVFDGNGQIHHFEGTAQDIGWRKLAEQILNQAEEKWRAVVDSSGECIVIADRSGTVLFGNQRALQSEMGCAGENVFAGFSTVSQQQLRAAIDGAFRSMQPGVLTLDRATSGTDRAWFEVRVVPIGSIDSSERVIFIATDLTAKKRAEEAVRESQRLIGRVADASPAILYVYDFGTERYVYVNHKVESILGYTTGEFLAGGSVSSERLVHQDDVAILTQRRHLLTEAKDEAVVIEYTFRMRHGHGEWRWIRARDVVFTRDADGRPEQILGMAEDVTERRRAGQEQERSRDQLRALSARLQEAREEERAAISRHVHDELGQALTALSWELSKLADQVDAPADAESAVARRLAGMSSMVDAMMQIVRKVAAELRPPILDHFGLVAAIEWQAQEFQERYRIQCEVAARIRGSIPDRTVSTAIFRIFQEILTNVARHAGATKVRVEFNDSPRGFALLVHDNGRGITEGEQARSLGILGMRERAHLFGGSIEIRGASGRGTTVTVHVPAAGGKPGTAPRKESLHPPV